MIRSDINPDRKGTSNGIFSVKSAYEMLSNGKEVGGESLSAPLESSWNTEMEGPRVARSARKVSNK